MARIQTRAAATHKPRRRTAACRDGRPGAAKLACATADSDNARMDIVLNGQPRQIGTPITVLQLLELENLAERRVAVEVNGEIVPRSRHGLHVLAAGDRVEVVHALGGG